MTTKAKRILFIMHDLSRGGIQSFVYNLINALPKEKFTPIIFYYSDNNHMKSEFERLGIDIFYMSNENISRKFNSFKSLINEIRPDLIHFQGHEGMFIMFFWLKLMGYGRKILNTFHSTHFDELRGLNRFKELLVQFCIYKFIHVAEETETRYSNFYLTPSKKHCTIYNGIDIKQFQQKIINCQTHPIMDPNKFNILGVATFNPQKGYKYSIPAMHKVVNSYSHVIYHIVGGAYEHTETFEWAKEYIKKHNLEKKIILHGVQKNIAQFLKGANLFLSPSEKEILPVSFLEALAAGLPIIGTSVGGVPEILGKSNEWGIIINPRNESEIIESTKKFILSKELCNEYKNKSLERALFFDIHRIAKLYMEEYEQII